MAQQPRPEAAEDDVIEALDQVVEAAEASVADGRQIIDTAAQIKDLRAGGHSWHSIMQREGRPRVVERISGMLGRLADASGRFRRSQARALRAEGVTTEQVASLFGVTRQRVSALLRPANDRPGDHSPAGEDRPAVEDRPAPAVGFDVQPDVQSE